MWKKLFKRVFYETIEDFASFRNKLVLGYLGSSMFLKYLSIKMSCPNAAMIITALSVCDTLIFGYYLKTRHQSQTQNGTSVHKSEFKEGGGIK